MRFCRRWGGVPNTFSAQQFFLRVAQLRAYISNMKTQRLETGTGAFTLVEVLVVVSVMAILGAVGFATMTGVRDAATNQKLLTDVETVNRALDLYRANGGNLTGVTNADAVIAKLKTRADAASAARTLGMRQNFLDERVQIIWQTAAETASSAPRALWNGTNFVVATSGGPGIKEFAYDEARAATVSTEAREISVKEASDSGWVWSYSESNLAAAERTASEVALGVMPGGLFVSVHEAARGVLETGPSGEVGVGYAFREAGYNGRLALVSLEGMENYDLTTPEGRRAFMIELVRRVVEGDRGQIIIDASKQKVGGAANTFYFRPGDKLVPVLIPNASFQQAYNDLLSNTYKAKTFPLTSMNMGTDEAPFYQRQVASLGNGGYSIEDIAGGGDADYDDMVFRLTGVIQDDSQQFLQIDPTTYFPQRLAQLRKTYWDKPYKGGPSLHQALINSGILP